MKLGKEEGGREEKGGVLVPWPGSNG